LQALLELAHQPETVVGAEAEIADTVSINRSVRWDHQRFKERGQRHGLGRGVADAVEDPDSSRACHARCLLKQRRLPHANSAAHQDNAAPSAGQRVELSIDAADLLPSPQKRGRLLELDACRHCVTVTNTQEPGLLVSAQPLLHRAGQAG
jgi:hypothetical protein